MQYLSPGQMGAPPAGYMARDPSSDFDYQSGYNAMAAAPPPPPPAGLSGIFATTGDGIQQLQGNMGGDYSLYPSSRVVPPGPPPPPPPQAASFVADGAYQHGAADFYIPPQPPSLLAFGQSSIFSSRNEAVGQGGGAADSAASYPRSAARRNGSGCECRNGARLRAYGSMYCWGSQRNRSNYPAAGISFPGLTGRPDCISISPWVFASVPMRMCAARGPGALLRQRAGVGAGGG